MTAAAPRGGLYTLRLAASLAQLDGSARAFYQTTLSLAMLFGAALFVLQALQARRLGTRFAVLRAHVAALREGQLDHDLADDPQRDEIGELHHVLRETTAKRAARSGQERLLADAAHELRHRSDLCARLDLALRKPRPPEELRASMEEVRREVNRSSTLCQQLLERFALGKRNGIVCRCSCTRSRSKPSRRPRRGRSARCAHRDRRRRRHPGPGHAPALRQGLDNLLSNALRYAPRSSSIR